MSSEFTENPQAGPINYYEDPIARVRNFNFICEAAPAASVRESRLQVTEDAETCSLNAHLNIIGEAANMEVRYRFEHSTGRRSNVFSARTRSNQTATAFHEWPVSPGPGRERGWLKVVGIDPPFETGRENYSMECNPPAPSGTLGPTTQTAAAVESARTTLQEQTAGGRCRIDTRTTIRTNRGNMEVSYRFRFSSGETSDVFTTRIRQRPFKTVNHSFDIPNGPGVEQGTVQMIGVEPEFTGHAANYRMLCN